MFLFFLKKNYLKKFLQENKKNIAKKKYFFCKNKFYRLCSCLKFLTICSFSLMSFEKISFIMVCNVLLFKALWLMVLLFCLDQTRFCKNIIENVHKQSQFNSEFDFLKLRCSCKESFLILKIVLTNEKRFELSLLSDLFFLRHFWPCFNAKFHSTKL